MSINNSIIRLRGSIGGMTFYESDGKNVVRLTRGPSKSAIKNNPAFKRTRENISEFSGAAKAGKAFRTAFADVVTGMGDRWLTSRLTGFMKRLINMGTGTRGKRAVDIALNKLWFKGFEFNERKTLGSVFFPHYDEPVFNANRDVATLSIPEFDTDACIKAPVGSTHFRILLAAGVVSNYLYDDELNEYVPADTDYNTLRALVVSPAIPCGGLSGGPVDLSADLGIGGTLPVNVTVMAAVGIVFYQEINSQLYELASNNAMRIDAVS